MPGRRFTPISLLACLTVSVALTLTGCVGGGASSGSGLDPAGSCSAGKFALGSVHHFKDSAGHSANVTGGKCFDTIDNPGTLLNLNPAASKIVEQTFCSKLDVQPELNKALGHGIRSFSNVSLANQIPTDDTAPQGECNWSENYLHLINKPGIQYWKLVSVSYVKSTQALADYLQLVRASASTSGATATQLKGLGTYAEEFTSIVQETATSPKVRNHSVMATDQKSTVLIGDNSSAAAGDLKDIAKKALALADTLTPVKPSPAATAAIGTGNGSAWQLADTCPATSDVAAASGWSLTDSPAAGKPLFEDASDAWTATTCTYQSSDPTKGSAIYLVPFSSTLGQKGASVTSDPSLGVGANIDSDPGGSDNQCELVVPAVSDSGWSGGYSVEIVDNPGSLSDCSHIVAIMRTVASQTASEASAIPSDPTPEQTFVKYSVDCLDTSNTAQAIQTSAASWSSADRAAIWNDANTNQCSDAATRIDALPYVQG